ARTIDSTHSAFADEGQYFELWKQPGKFFDLRRLELCAFRMGGVGRSALFHQAGRTKPGQDAGGQGSATLRAFVFHVSVCSIHTSLSYANARICYKNSFASCGAARRPSEYPMRPIYG